LSDLTQCQSIKCIKRNQCYRVLATPSDPQTYALFEQVCTELNDYKYFWQARKEFIKEEVIKDNK